ncbi:MAG: Co/Zn/Cd efflux system component [Gammaproteobacteria bacterium]|jgi:Co/Zn/Cd efflux system component
MAGCACPIDSRPATEPRFRRVLWVALIANAAMFIVEVMAATASGSMSLYADSLDFLGDAANYAITLVVLGMSLRARSGAALIKAATMAAFGLWVIANAVSRAFTDLVPDAPMMGSVAVLALVVNLAVAVALFRFRDGDSNKQSIWLCSRNDAIGNITVLIAASGVHVSTSAWPDLVVAALIAGLSLSAAWRVLNLAIAERREHNHPPRRFVTTEDAGGAD